MLLQCMVAVSIFHTKFSQLLFSLQFPRREVESETEKQSEERNRKMNILLQLQYLFARLKHSNKRAIYTNDLTTSFGWDKENVCWYNSIQELRLVLLDQIDKIFKGNEISSCVFDLFGVTLQTYIQCLNCGRRNTRDEIHSAIELRIQGAINIDESFNILLQSEELSGENQYWCSNCNIKTDALSGICFVRLPPILTLNICRFGFDIVTWKAIKHDDYLEFPFELDMKKYTKEEGGCYSLYAVVVHTGVSGDCGFHYTLIKSPSDGEWYRFSDTQVTKVTLNEVEETFGNKKTQPNAKRNGNAIVLLYRSDSIVDKSDFEIPQFVLEKTRNYERK